MLTSSWIKYQRIEEIKEMEVVRLYVPARRIRLVR